MASPLLRRCAARLARPRRLASSLAAAPRASTGSLSQQPGSDRVRFPGAVDSQFTSEMTFTRPSEMAAIPTYRVMDADGVLVDQTRAPPDVSDREMVAWYQHMLTVSIMDTIMFEAQRQGRLSFYMVRSPFVFSLQPAHRHTGQVSAGEEGISVGSAAALTPDDVVFAQYREHGVLQKRGFSLRRFMSQLLANKNDTSKGRNMPVHFGCAYPRQAAGAAYALKLRRLQNPNLPARITACYFGEGAASEGDFHAALNMAATRACPVVFICRNNGYAISTPTLEQYRGDGIASRGIGYGIDTIRVDGNDIFAVYEATRAARRLALSDDAGGKPVLIEAMSYRVSHHSTSDDSFAYRARGEVDDWKRGDNPIIRLRKFLERRGLWDDDRDRQARDQVRRAVLAEFSAAELEKKAPLRSVFEDVYEELTEEQAEQRRELRRILETYPDEYDLREFEDGLQGL
ncbi:hypothetical protein VTN02DRAFT_887 [Thermoascus thermophilus]